jgi:large subunit ribosomal protein L4
MPKKMRQLALRCVLSAKATLGELKVVEELKFAEPKTKKLAQILTALGIDSSALIITGEPESNTTKSASNLPEVKTMPAALLNVLETLSHKTLLMTEAAVRKAEQLWGERTVQGGNNASLRGAAPPANN